MTPFGRFLAWMLLTGTVCAWSGEDAAKAPEPATEAPKAADTKAEPKSDTKAEPDKAPLPAPPGMPQFPLKSEFFAMVLDHQVEDQHEAQQIESNAMNDILKAISDSSEEHLIASINDKVKFRELMLRSEQYRGHVVRIRGLLEATETMKIGDNPAGIQRVYMGQISNLMGEVVTFISLTPPEGTGKVPVRLTGVFLKRYAYLNRQEGEKLTWTPLIFVKRVEPYSEEDERSKGSQKSLISYILSGAVFAVFLAWFIFRLTRYTNSRRMKDNPFSRKKKQMAEQKSKESAG